MKHFQFNSTPISKLETLSRNLKTNIYMKRDDLFEHAGGGSKSRMLQYIIYKAINTGHNYIVTAGGPYSNFNRALALMCGKYNLKMVLVLYDKNTHINKESLNKRICDFCDVTYINSSPSKVSESISQQMRILKSKGEKPYYIWGGGKSNEGVYAYFDSIRELKHQLSFEPDVICSAVGTGTTICGVSLGVQKYYSDTKVWGFSVARHKENCINVLKEVYSEFSSIINIEEPKWGDIINDQFILGGYGKTTTELDSFLKYYVKREGIIMDNIYVGKALFGLFNKLKDNDEYKNKNIVFINTGGIYNF